MRVTEVARLLGVVAGHKVISQMRERSETGARRKQNYRGVISGPMNGRDDGEELVQPRHFLYLTPRSEHVMGQMELVILQPIVGCKKFLTARHMHSTVLM
jgi:hypothetical protein